MENWVLSRLPKPPVNHRGPSAHMSSTSQALPCCPPYWMMFRSPQESRLSRGRSSEFREMGPRPRSLSLSAADSRPPYIHRTVKFLLADSERDCGGYSEDDEGSSTEEDNFSRKRGEQSKGSRSKAPFSRLKELQQNPPHHLTAQTSPRSVSSHRKSKSASHEPQNVPPPPNREQSRVGSPLSYSQRVSKKRQSVPNSSGRRNQRLPTSRAFLQPRPSSAGTLPSSRNPRSTGQALRPRSSHGRASTYDSSKELLSALNQDERDLLEAITEKGYSLHTAIIALQKTGHRKPEQILSYLMACDRLCGQGYDKTQVEEALEMFQSCESKAAEFLHLLAQFNEMGFQQNAIKEVLLVHENHRERALEELMTRVA
ncbi:uncharacterized protein LOC114766857 isoform X2 [Denticeps clupeoides]|uniref:UBA domain-containing protein n=2 Tax=Denticeps clupeoides TaxID=299321 RepID=A0AAY4CNG0_9TELE|nr:uncharacterized protein LOC114766857 isoform X2 [Denticeps clupeoides]